MYTGTSDYQTPYYYPYANQYYMPYQNWFYPS